MKNAHRINYLDLIYRITRGLMIKDGPPLKNVEILFFCHDDDRGEKLDGKHFATIADSFRKECEFLGYSCATIAHPWSKLSGKVTCGDAITINRKFFKAGLKQKIYNFFGGRKIKKYLTGIYKTIVSNSGANLVITIGCPEALAIACRELGVAHAELLHAMGYATVEWNWESKPKKCLPQFILTFDQLSTKTFSRLSKQDVKVFQLPHPYIAKFINKNEGFPFPNEWEKKITVDEKKKHILVCLQWGYDGELSQYKGLLENGLYPKALETVFEDTSETIEWCMRAHPIHLKNLKYKHHLNLLKSLSYKFKNVSWEPWSMFSLPNILPHMSGCLSMSSFSAYDATQFGVTSVLMCPTLQKGNEAENWFSDLVLEDYVLKKNFDKEFIVNWSCTVEQKKSLILSANNQTIIPVLLDKLLNK